MEPVTSPRPTLIIQPRSQAVLRHHVRRVREILTTMSPGLVVAILTLVAAVAVTVAILILAAAGVIVTVTILVIRWRNGLPRNLLGQRRIRGRWVGRAR